MKSLPSLFISHGAPNLVIDDTPASQFIRSYGASLARPARVVVASAHFEAETALVTADRSPEMIYDFNGFEPELYRMRYPAPGDPALAERVVDLLSDNGIDSALAHDRGYDHGTWVPLMLLLPDADVPVVQLSVSPRKGAEYHYRLGQALRPLGEENILVIGSGSLTHNLAVLFRNGLDNQAKTSDWVETFAEWMHRNVGAGAVEALIDYRSQAPYAVENHPSEEHLLPFFVAAGAARSGGRQGERVHASTAFGVLSMDAYAFN